MSSFAGELLDQDLGVKPGNLHEARTDRDKFVFATNWGKWVRVPISYLVKLSLADLPFGLREFDDMGFFGFEGRHYSLFASMTEDFGPAADLQQLITVLAYKYVLSGKYTHRHLPVSGQVVDFYEMNGRYHSCNPHATVSLITPYSKNRRVVTILQTDIAGGPHLGLVAIIEVVALMVGRVEQRYSEDKYHFPRPILPGMFLKRGPAEKYFSTR